MTDLNTAKGSRNFELIRHIPEALKPPLRLVDRIRFKVLHGVYFPQHSSDNFVNESEIRVFGLQRSGNHAIINWIFLNLSGTVCFLNFIRYDRHHNPYLTFGQAFLKNGTDILNYKPNDPTKRYRVREWHHQHPQKQALLYSYENRSLNGVTNDALSNDHDRCVGRSHNTLNILILRDPFNWAASTLKKKMSLTPKKVELWKMYAREFLGESNFLGPSLLPISYNAWCIDHDYRRSLAQRLGLSSIDQGVGDVPDIGGGSSFDATGFDGNAQSMQTTERWRDYENNAVFQRVFNDEELFELSTRIFGVLPGTEVLL